MRKKSVFLLLFFGLCLGLSAMGQSKIAVMVGSEAVRVDDYLRSLVMVPASPPELTVDISLDIDEDPVVLYSGERNPVIRITPNQTVDLVFFHINSDAEMALLWPDIVEDPGLNTRVRAGHTVTIPSIYRFYGDDQGREFFQAFVFSSMDQEIRGKIETLARESQEGIAYEMSHPFEEGHFMSGEANAIDSKGRMERDAGDWSSNMVDFYFNTEPTTYSVKLQVPANPYWFLDGKRVDASSGTFLLEKGPHLVHYYLYGKLYREIVEVERNNQQIKVSYHPVPTEKRKIFAFLVGINDYPVGFHLSTPVTDVNVVKELLTSAAAKENATLQTKILVDQQATRRAISSFLQEGIFDHIDQNTDVLFFFSGHGGSVADTNGDEDDGLDEVLVPVDFRWQNSYDNMLDPDSCLLDDDLGEYLRAIAEKSRNLFVVFDSCFSGSSNRGGKGIPQPLGRNSADINQDAMTKDMGRIRDNFVFLASSKGDQESYADPTGTLGMSLFTYFLRQALQGKADGFGGSSQDGWIDPNELIGFLEEQIPAWVKENMYGEPIPEPLLINPLQREWNLKY
ncbi:MAG TPA: caspase family protein [Thermotogota bacterium]|nr:caspase family protein [Thermotogota bacterium]